MSGIDWIMAASTIAMSAALISLPIIAFLLCPVRVGRLPPQVRTGGFNANIRDVEPRDLAHPEATARRQAKQDEV